METSFYRQPKKSENRNPNKTLSGPTAQRGEPWETRCLFTFTHDGGWRGGRSGTDRPAVTLGSSLQTVTTSKILRSVRRLTSKRRRHGAIYPGTLWRVVTWQSRGTNWVYCLRSRDHRGARPQQLPPPALKERAGGGAAPAAASIHTSGKQQRNRVRSLAERSSGSGQQSKIYYKAAALQHYNRGIPHLLN